MNVTFQKGNIFSSPPMNISGVDYVVVSTNKGDIFMILQSLDDSTVLALEADDPRFEEILTTLGLEKNQSNVKELQIG